MVTWDWSLPICSTNSVFSLSILSSDFSSAFRSSVVCRMIALKRCLSISNYNFELTICKNKCGLRLRCGAGVTHFPSWMSWFAIRVRLLWCQELYFGVLTPLSRESVGAFGCLSVPTPFSIWIRLPAIRLPSEFLG